ncbi:PEP-CTERM sorting domain-containing protein [Chamaesiphon sp.]|uniref:PEP-CTERM sorting domain-containing protein n=1 Tax=Chamaesiphon sp. TaxID=2814140 RepID=UPI0035933219
MKLRSFSLVTGIAVSGLVAMGAFTPAYAVGTLLTTEVGYTGLPLDLSDYAIGDNNYTNGPLPIPGGITFTSTATNGSTLGQNIPGFNYSLSANGIIDSIPVFAGLDQTIPEAAYMEFSFATPVQQFGAFLNYAPDFQPGFNSPTIGTYDSAGNQLSIFDLETTPGGKISTPGQTNVFVFRGIAEDSAIISSFRLSGGNIVAAGQPYNLPASTAVPEPFTIIGTLIGGTAALRMRKKLKSTKV